MSSFIFKNVLRLNIKFSRVERNYLLYTYLLCKEGSIIVTTIRGLWKISIVLKRKHKKPIYKGNI